MFERLKNMLRRTKAADAGSRAYAVAVSNMRMSVFSISEKKELIEAYKGWVYVCSMINANAVAQTPLRLYTTKPAVTTRALKMRGRHAALKPITKDHMADLKSRSSLVQKLHLASEIEQVEEHDILDLLRTPNPNTDQYELIEGMSVYLDVIGESYTEVVFSKEKVEGQKRGIPMELWNLPAQQMVIEKSTEKFITQFVRRAGMKVVEYEPDEIIYMRCFNPDDQWTGFGPGEGAWDSVNVDDRVRMYQGALMENMAVPAILAFVKDLSPEQAERFETDWLDKFLGKTRGGKFGAFDGEVVKIEKIGFDPKSLDLRESQRGLRDEIAAAFGVPIGMITAEDVNRATIQGHQLQHAKNAVSPRHRRMEQKFNNANGLVQMFPMSDGLFLAFDSVIEKDRVEEAELWDKRLKNGSATINEYRVHLGEQTVAWGDKPLLQANIIPLGSAPPAAVGGANPGAGKDTTLVDVIREVRGLIDNERNENGTSDRSQGGNPQFDDRYRGNCIHSSNGKRSLAEGYVTDPWTDHDGKAPNKPLRDPLVDNLPEVAPMKATMREYLKDLGDAVAVALVRTETAAGATGIPAVTRERELAKQLRPQVKSIIARRGKQAMATIVEAWAEHGGGVLAASFDVDTPAVVQFVERHPLRTAKGITSTTLDRLKTAIETGIAAGSSIPKIAAELKKNPWIGKARAEMIARTEVQRSVHLGAELAMMQSGVVEAKEWLPAGDACEFCLATANAANAKLGESFYSVGDTVRGVDGGTLSVNYLAVSGPPLHPGCRCTTVPVLIDVPVEG